MQTRARRVSLIPAALLALILTGCANTNDEVNAEHGRQIEARIPDLVRSAGWDSIGSLREDSCSYKGNAESAAHTTRWIASTGRRDLTLAEAEDVAAGIRAHAESTGWVTGEDSAGPHGDLLYQAALGDIRLIVTYEPESEVQTRSSTGLRLSTPCLDMPAGHTLTRSELDPMYGSSDPVYPNDDRSKFTNGEPKPLPSSS